MFTGLIEMMGTVRLIQEEGPGLRLMIDMPACQPAFVMGESVAVNGACLTVVHVDSDAVAFQVGPETMAKTNFGRLRLNDRVNLERSLRVGDRLGGHWVQGHVDGIGRITGQESQADWQLTWIDCPSTLAGQMVPKGSIAVDGVSLTLVQVHPSRFSVALIPHTLAHTTLGDRRLGDTVNLETDIMGKYVQKYLGSLTIPR